MRLDTVVVGLDFTEAGSEAVTWIARHVVPSARLVLVHCIDVPEPPGFLRGRFPSRDELITTAHLGAEERLREIARGLGMDGAEVVIRDGAAAEQLLAVVRERDAALVVVGPHGERTGVWRLIGGTAQRIARTSPVPVLVARGAAERAPARILVALDESTLTHAVLRHAVALTRHFGAQLVALHVIGDSVMGALRIGGTEAETRDAASRVEESAREWLLERLAEHDVSAAAADVEVRVGDAAHQILSMAQEREIDLIVLGRSGAGKVGDLILGSVANSVLRNGTGPLLLVGHADS